MNIVEELRSAEEQIQKNRFYHCVQECGTLLEKMLRDRALWIRGESRTSKELLDKMHKAESEIGDCKTSISEFALGPLYVFYMKTGLFNELRKLLASPLRNIETAINWDTARNWRNCAAHGKDEDSLGKFEAQQMLLWTQMAARDLEFIPIEETVQRIDEIETTICSGCGKGVEAEWKFCPFCGRPMSSVCLMCMRPVEYNWKVCPYCETRLQEISSEEDARSKREYTLLCRGVWADKRLNADERGFLEDRRLSLGLSYSTARGIESCEAPEGYLEFQSVVEAVVSDGTLTSVEEDFLIEKAKRLNIPEEQAEEVIKTVIQALS